MTDQAGYDRLLWSCDLNLVRGKTPSCGPSGQGALPVAHLPQDDEAHIAKLDDFLDHYLATLPADAARWLRDASHALNHGQALGELWARWPIHAAHWQQHARAWSQKLLAEGISSRGW